MKKEKNIPYGIPSISEQHRLLGLPKPQHPLVSVFDFADVKYEHSQLQEGNFFLPFYCIAIKKNFKGKFKYGQHYYDFDEGMMSFISPNQVLAISDESATEGCCLAFHPDFLANYALGKTIRNYGFFSYALNEALHLSEKEEQMIMSIFHHIQQEYSSPIDTFSQDVIVSHIEVLLNYSNRFYTRQFITRKNANAGLLANLESLLAGYYEAEKMEGIPTVQYISGKLNISPNYLSDMLKSTTGQTTQQHIHQHLINKAKEILATTNLSVSEIAYQLGFEYPQSFNKLFKNKTNMSPLQYRESFN
ncbi:MAG: helix-turn-helix domain-containing protein [Gloeobacteraceae cyanobacterium ES-bin-316]|nr:helix-turn-helix domain-containing protein [Ferruginibacter sp.]